MDLDDIAREQAEWDNRSRAAQGAAAHAFARLLEMAETQHGGQSRYAAQFVASTYDGDAFPFDFFVLRAVDVSVSDDMLVCLDALRWGRAGLNTLVPSGKARVHAVLELWGLAPRLR